MKKYSSKSLTLLAATELINFAESSNEKQINANGVLLLTSFGFVCGKILKINSNGQKRTVADIILNSKNKLVESIENDNDEVIKDGSAIIIKDAKITYASNKFTFNMDEFIIFSDQIIGFYPIDLENFHSQIPD